MQSLYNAMLEVHKMDCVISDSREKDAVQSLYSAIFEVHKNGACYK